MTSNHVEVLDIRIEVNETWIDGDREYTNFTVRIDNGRLLCANVSSERAIQRITEVIEDM